VECLGCTQVSGEQFDHQYHQSHEKHENGNLVDRMHGFQVEAIAPVGRGSLLFEAEVRKNFAPDFHIHLRIGDKDSESSLMGESVSRHASMARDVFGSRSFKNKKLRASSEFFDPISHQHKSRIDNYFVPSSNSIPLLVYHSGEA
jgi:hypothetical protein